MHKQPLFIFLFFLILFIAILNIIALQLHLYFALPWFDNLMHFLGGLWLGLGSLWLFFVSGYGRGRVFTKRFALFLSLSVAVFVGILWELFEVYGGIAQFQENYLLDTTHDLIMDALGALVGYFYFLYGYVRKKSLNE